MRETIRDRLKRHMFWSNTFIVVIAFFGFALPALMPLASDTRRLTAAIGPVPEVVEGEGVVSVRGFPGTGLSAPVAASVEKPASCTDVGNKSSLRSRSFW